MCMLLCLIKGMSFFSESVELQSLSKVQLTFYLDTSFKGSLVLVYCMVNLNFKMNFPNALDIADFLKPKMSHQFADFSKNPTNVSSQRIYDHSSPIPIISFH